MERATQPDRRTTVAVRSAEPGTEGANSSWGGDYSRPSRAVSGNRVKISANKIRNSMEHHPHEHHPTRSATVFDAIHTSIYEVYKHLAHGRYYSVDCIFVGHFCSVSLSTPQLVVHFRKFPNIVQLGRISVYLFYNSR